jgi:hypothetical protein
MTAPDPRWEEEARRWLEQMRSPRNAIQGEWAQSLTALLARVAEEARGIATTLQRCEICWTSSWVPVPADDPDARKLVSSSGDAQWGSVRCDHCWLQGQYIAQVKRASEAHAAGRAEMREEAAKKCEYIYDHGLAGAHQGEMCNRVAKAIRSLPTAKSAKPPHVCYHWHTNGRCVVCGEPKPGGEALPLPEFPSKDPSDHPYEDWLTNKERADYPAVPPSRCIRCGYPAGVHGR